MLVLVLARLVLLEVAAAVAAVVAAVQGESRWEKCCRY
jgi:hypothetical protein